MKKISLLLIAISLWSSCKEAHEGDSEKKGWAKSEIGEITLIETLFEETNFPAASHYNLLKELNICDTILSESAPCSLCTPKNFKLFPYKNDAALEDAFVLQVKAETILKGQEKPLPLRHLIVFERIDGELVKVNGFRGNLIATRTSDSGARDLIVRFYVAEDDVFLNCLFTWDGEHYKYKSVEAIFGSGGNGSVKESMKDSISKEVYQSLMSNAMIF